MAFFSDFRYALFMLTHARIWAALDALADRLGTSPSGLARMAGLDPTCFNKSKRTNRNGKPHWPSTESLARVLDVVGGDLSDLLSLSDPQQTATPAPPPGTIPLIGLAQAGDAGFFDDAGYPIGGGWSDIPFPDIGDPSAYALEVAGDSMEPLYRAGDILIVSPASSIRRGDRVVVKTAEGEILAKHLLRRTATHLELESLNPLYPKRTLDLRYVAWVARILWVSQ